MPPYRPFRLQTHINEHLNRNPTHVIGYYCWDDMELEDEWRRSDTPHWLPAGQTELPAERHLNLYRPPNRLGLPSPEIAIMAALQVLRSAGYTFTLNGSKEPSEKAIDLLPHEAEILVAIRERPGSTLVALAKRLGVSYSTARNRVRMLCKAGHVLGAERLYEDVGQVSRSLFPAHARPITVTRPRQQVHIGGRKRIALQQAPVGATLQH